MKLIATLFLVMSVTASFAFADQMTNTQAGSQGTQATHQSGNAIVVHKNKKEVKKGQNSGTTQETQIRQTDGTAH